MKLRDYFAEFLGTMLFAAFLVGAVVSNAMLQQFERSFLGVCVCAGLAGFVLNACFSAQINPIVSFAIALQRRQSWTEFLARFLLQIAACFAGVATLRLTLGEFNMSALEYGVSALGKEIQVGAGSVLTILGSILLAAPWFRSHGNRVVGSICFGAAIGISLFVLGPFCGGLQNPALHLASAVLASRFDHALLFLALPFVGGLLIGVFGEKDSNPDFPPCEQH